MIKTYDVKSAQETILKRNYNHLLEYPENLIKSTEKLFGIGVSPDKAVDIILRSVRENGDRAIAEWTKLLDGINITDIRISAELIENAYRSLSPSLLDVFKLSASRIKLFHEQQPLPNWETTTLGGILGQRTTPIERVGVYVPGGTAPLPSSLLMSVIPAQVAGVNQIIICTPPNPDKSILAAAAICNIKDVFLAGGAQAVAAMAYGTKTIPKVDKIVGAGNLYVTLAKQKVYGTVGIEGLAGPTETMVIADKTANPAWVASDLLAQAEHDYLASAILLTPDADIARTVAAEIDNQLAKLSRSEMIETSLQNRGGIVLTPDLRSAAMLADDYGPEHLCLSVEKPEEVAGWINNAGGIFFGENSYEVLGDYMAGPSHIMPTGGTARFSSPLNVLDFVKISSVISLDPETSLELSPPAAKFAQTESLTGHAAAANYRIKQ